MQFLILGVLCYRGAMRQFLLTVFAATLCIIEPSFAQDETLDRAPWDNAASGLDGSVVAFVGEKIFVEERNLEETMDVTLPDGSVVARVIPKMSDRYEARYKIFDVVGGRTNWFFGPATIRGGKALSLRRKSVKNFQLYKQNVSCTAAPQNSLQSGNGKKRQHKCRYGLCRRQRLKRPHACGLHQPLRSRRYSLRIHTAHRQINSPASRN